jgi:PAS domain S-box-containing protein
MRTFVDIPLQNKLKRWSKYIVGVVIVGAVAVLIGWRYYIDYLKSPLPGSKEMNPAAAVAFIFSGLSFLLITSTPFSRSKQIIGKLLALFVLLIGTGKLLFYVARVNLHIDEVLFADRIGADRIVAIASVCFVLAGASLLMIDTKGKRNDRLSDTLLLILISLSVFSILGYFFQVSLFYGLFTYVPMAVHAAVCFLFLSLGIFLFNSDRGLMQNLTTTLAGSVAARRLIPAAILVPVLLGILRTVAHQESLFTIEFGITILVFSIIVVLMTIIWHNTRLLNKRDLERQRAQRAQRQSEEQIQTIFRAAPDAVIVIDESGTILKWNSKAESIFGWQNAEVLGRSLPQTILPKRFWERENGGLHYFLASDQDAVPETTFEIRAINKNNEEIDVAFSISPTMVDGKNVFIGFARDITEQKKAEQKLKESEEKYSILFNSIDEGFCIIEMIFDEQKKPADYRFLVVNASFEKQTGLRDAVGRRMREFAPDHEQHWFETYGRIALTGESIRFENRAEQLHRWYDVYAFRFGEPKDMQVAILFNDITEQRKAGEQLKESEEKFQKAFQASSAGISITRLSDATYLDVNDAFTKLTGFSKDELIGHTSPELGMVVDVSKREKVLQEVREIGSAKNFEIAVRDKSGKTLEVLASIETILLQGEKYALNIIYDITEQKKAEKKFRGLLESAPDAMIIVNETGEIVLVNHQTETLFGYKKEELINQQVEILIPAHLSQKHSRHRSDYFKHPKIRSMGTGLELFAVRKDGTRFPVEISLSPLETAEGTLVSAAIRDITDRKMAEAIIQKQTQDIQDFIDSMSTMCAKVATDGRLLMVNKIAIKASGLPIEELMITNFLEGQWWTYDPEVHARVCKAFKKASSGIPINYDENIYAFGQILPINFSLMPIMGLDGNVDYIVAEGRDISAIKLTEAALQKRTNELEQANRELEAFSYSVSHDLRAPLRIIDGYSEIVVNDYGSKMDDEGKKLVGVIRENTSKMGQLIDDLLNLSRLGRKELVIQTVDMKKMVESVAAEQISSQNRIVNP